MKTSDTALRKIYLSHFIERVRKDYSRFYCETELETEQNCNILTPTLIAISVVSFSFSRAAQPEARGLTLLGAGFLYRILPLTGLVSKLHSKLTDFLSSPSYIIVQSPAQYLLNGMFDRHQAEITVMQFTGHSLPVHQSHCTVGFYLVPYCQPSQPTPMEYATSASLEWYVWPGRRSIYNTITSDDFQNSNKQKSSY